MNPIRPLFVMLILALAPGLAKGQIAPAIPPAPTAPPADLRGSLSFSLENDVFNDTDRFYTNGVQLSWYSPSAELPQPLAWLDRQLDGVLGPGQLRWGAALGHSIFTPQDTERRNPNPSDRPYVGLLYGTVSLVGDAMYGLAVMYAGVRLTYTQVLRTEEFYGQRGGVQRFASLSATFRF